MAIDYSATDHAFTKGYVTGLTKRALVHCSEPATPEGLARITEILEEIVKKCEDI